MAWDWLFKGKRKREAEAKPKKKLGRPTKEMLVARRSKKIQELKDQILEAKLQAQLDALKNSGSEGAYSLRIDDIPRIQRQLQRVGLDVDLRDGDEPDEKSWLKGFLQSDEGKTLVLLLAQRFLPVLPTPQAPAQLPAQSPPAAPATAPPAPQQPEQPKAVEPTPDGAADSNAGISEALIAGLDGKAPAAAALWLIEWSGQQQGGDTFLQFLAGIPPQSLAGTVQQIAMVRPYLAAFAVWLAHPDRASWVIETSIELRQRIPNSTGSG